MSKIMIVLTGQRWNALGIYATSRVKTLEFDPDFEMPETERFAPSTMPRYPRSHDKMYLDGGTHAPGRWIFND